MKQIFNFEENTPPILTENTLRAELEKRRLQRQTTLLAIGSMLLLFCILLMALLLYPSMPMLSAACALYVCIAVTGGCVIALIFIQKRRFFLK